MKTQDLILRSSALTLTLILTWVAGCSRRDDPAQHLQTANRLFDNREFEKAKIEYVNTLRLQPTNGFAVARVGKILLAQGQIVDAAPWVVGSRREFPEDLEIRAGFIELLSHAEGETNLMTLRTEIDELLQRDPANEKAILNLVAISQTPEALTELTTRLVALRAKAGERPIFKLAEAEILRRRGNTNGCEAAIRAAIGLDTQNPNSHASYAAFLFGQRRTAEGEAALRKAAELAPPYSPVRESWARYLLQIGRFDDARAAYDEIIAKAPERVSAWVGRAGLALAERKPEEAERFLSRALGQAPNDSEARRTLAQLRLSEGRPADAVNELERVVQRQPGSVQGQYQLAVAHLLNKDLGRAVGTLEQSVQRNPGFLSAELLLAELNINRGEADRAATSLREVLRRSPDLEQAHLLLIRAERAAGRDDAALAAATTAKQRFPTNAALAFQQGLILRQARKPNEARAAFEDAARLTTNNLPAIGKLVALDLQAKDGPGALRRVQAALDLKPRDPDVWLLKSEVHLALRDAAQAEAAARKAIELSPENPAAFGALARAAIASGRQKDAIAELENVLKLRPNNLQALLLQGVLRSSFGEYAKARESYEAALKIRPNSRLLLNNLAYLLAENLNQPEQAREMAVKARQLAPNDPEVADTLGWIEYRRGQYPEALRLLTEAAAKSKNIPEIQYHLGMTHYMMGQELPARAALQLAAESSDDFKGRDVARDFLAMLQVDAGKVDDQAIQALEKRRKAAPSDVVALTRLGTAYELTDAPAKAQEAYEAALKLSPQSVPVLSRLATLYAGKLNNPTKAIELARRARGLAPNDPDIAFTLGRLALGAGDQAWAYTLLQDSARQLTNRADVAREFAWAAYSQARIDEAVRSMQNAAAIGDDPRLTNSASAFLEMIALTRNPPPSPQAVPRIQQVLAADPNHGPALFAYGLVAEAQGQFPNARTAYERLLARYPAFLPAARQLAILCAERLGDDARARELGTRLREAYSRDDVLTAALGKVACRGGDFIYAAQLLSQAAGSRTQDASLFYHLGVASEGLKKPAEAKANLEKALSLDAKAPFAEDARKRLEKLKAG